MGGIPDTYEPHSPTNVIAASLTRKATCRQVDVCERLEGRVGVLESLVPCLAHLLPAALVAVGLSGASESKVFAGRAYGVPAGQDRLLGGPDFFEGPLVGPLWVGFARPGLSSRPCAA